MHSPIPDVGAKVVVHFADGTAKAAHRLEDVDFDAVPADVDSVAVSHPCPRCDCPKVKRFDSLEGRDDGEECDNCGESLAYWSAPFTIPFFGHTVGLKQIDGALDKFEAMRDARVFGQRADDATVKRMTRVSNLPVNFAIPGFLMMVIGSLASMFAATAMFGTAAGLVAYVLFILLVGKSLTAVFDYCQRRAERLVEPHFGDDFSSSLVRYSHYADVGREVERGEESLFELPPVNSTEAVEAQRTEELETVER